MAFPPKNIHFQWMSHIYIYTHDGSMSGPWYINANMTGGFHWWDPWHTIYSSTVRILWMGYTWPFQDISGRKFKAFVKPRPWWVSHLSPKKVVLRDAILLAELRSERGGAVNKKELLGVSELQWRIPNQWRFESENQQTKWGNLWDFSICHIWLPESWKNPYIRKHFYHNKRGDINRHPIEIP